MWVPGDFDIISELIMYIIKFWLHLRIEKWKRVSHLSKQQEAEQSVKSYCALEPIRVLTSKVLTRVKSD